MFFNTKTHLHKLFYRLKKMDETAIKEITGRSMKVVREYIKLYKGLNPEEVRNN